MHMRVCVVTTAVSIVTNTFLIPKKGFLGYKELVNVLPKNNPSKQNYA